MLFVLVGLFDHLGVDSIWMVAQERVVVTIFSNAALFEHDDAISVPHSCQAMGDHNRSDLAHLFFHMVDRFLHLSLVCFVKRARGLVEDEDSGVLDKCASKGDPLFLTSRKLAATSSDLLVDTLRVGADEFPGVALHECCLNFLVGGVRLAHQNVLLDGRVE